jgi:glutamyl-tRNA synthetase
MAIITRFAPSPTGNMHIGGVRTALINFLFAKKHNGKFILRIDDTDVNRNIEGVKEQILGDLEWVGISYDEQFSQLERKPLYAQKIEILKNNGFIYPCYETQEELKLEKERQSELKMPPLYHRKALSKEQILLYEAEGRKPHYRFYLGQDTIITLNDVIRGKISFDVKNLSDPIVIKEDGNVTYLLSSVIDDIENSVTHIIRGEDHIINTATQIQMFNAFNSILPSFAHLSLITQGGKKISKREGGYLIQDLKGKILPIALVNFLVNIGTENPFLIKDSLDAITKNFDLGNYSSSISNYEEENLLQINKIILSKLTVDELNKELNKCYSNCLITKEFWDIVKSNVKTLEEVLFWHQIIYSDVEQCNNLDKNYLKQAIALLPDQINIHTWDEWTKALSIKTERKGKDLYLPLRLALTGQAQGPCMKGLLPILGREKIVNRLCV